MHNFYPISSSCNIKGNSDVSEQCATFMKQRLYVKDTYQKQVRRILFDINDTALM